MILVAYRHGLRVERTGRPSVGPDRLQPGPPARPPRQAGHSQHASHPGRRAAGIAPAAADQDPMSPFVFTSERGSPFTTAGFARMVERAGVEAKLGFKAHPHMLRHACGFALANKGHDTRALQAYLGHRNIQHTVRYTELARTVSRTSGARYLVPECGGISQTDPSFREALWDRYSTAAPRPRTRSELQYSDRRLRSKS